MNGENKTQERYPAGQIASNNAEKLDFSLRTENNRLYLDFGDSPISWISFTKKQAEQLAEIFLTLSEKLK